MADEKGITHPVAAVFEQADGRITINPLPPPEPPYTQHKPEITYLWDDPRKGRCYRLNFGKKEIFLTWTEIHYLQQMLETDPCPSKPMERAATSGRVQT